MFTGLARGVAMRTRSNTARCVSTACRLSAVRVADFWVRASPMMTWISAAKTISFYASARLYPNRSGRAPLAEHDEGPGRIDIAAGKLCQLGQGRGSITEEPGGGEPLPGDPEFGTNRLGIVDENAGRHA